MVSDDRGIKLDNQHLTAIPDGLFQDRTLVALSLFQNALTDLPDALWRLMQLEKLNLALVSARSGAELDCRASGARLHGVSVAGL